MFLCKMMYLDFIFMVDFVNVKYIFKINFVNYDKGKFFYENFEIFLGDGIFNVDGEIWRM